MKIKNRNRKVGKRAQRKKRKDHILALLRKRRKDKNNGLIAGKKNKNRDKEVDKKENKNNTIRKEVGMIDINQKNQVLLQEVMNKICQMIQSRCKN